MGEHLSFGGEAPHSSPCDHAFTDEGRLRVRESASVSLRLDAVAGFVLHRRMHVDAPIAGRREHETDRQGVDHGHEAERAQRAHGRGNNVERDDDVEVAMRPPL